MYLKDRYEKVPKKPLTSAERKRAYDKKRQILQTIEDITWFEKNWPEAQLQLIFKAETIIPFVRALVDIGPLPTKHPHTPTPEQESKRKRIQELCRQILYELSAKSHIIAPEATRVLIADRTDRDTATRLAALLIGH